MKEFFKYLGFGLLVFIKDCFFSMLAILASPLIFLAWVLMNLIESGEEYDRQIQAAKTLKEKDVK